MNRMDKKRNALKHAGALALSALLLAPICGFAATHGDVNSAQKGADGYWYMGNRNGEIFRLKDDSVTSPQEFQQKYGGMMDHTPYLYSTSTNHHSAFGINNDFGFDSKKFVVITVNWHAAGDDYSKTIAVPVSSTNDEIEATTITAGTLTVTGTAAANTINNVSTNTSGNTSTGGTTTTRNLTTTGNTTLNNLTVNSATTLNGDTNAQTINNVSTNTSGSTTTKDLHVTNNTIIDKSLIVSGNETVIGKSTVGSQEVKGDSTVDGNQTIKKDLSVAGTSNLHDTNVDGTLDVTGVADFADSVAIKKDLAVTGTSNLHDTNVDGTLSVTGDSDLQGNSTVGKNLYVKGNSVVDGTSEFRGASHFMADVAMDQTLSVTGRTYLNNKVNIADDLNVKGNTTVEKKLTVKSDSEVFGNQKVHGNSHVGQNLSVAGNGSFGGSLLVNGPATFRMGADMGGHRITNVGDGRIASDSMDAVNGRQLWQMNRELTNDIRQTGSRAAALAGLHPLDYDPDKPTSISASWGNFRGENSLALGINHYFGEDALLTLGSTIGHQPMLNAGISLRLGRGNGNAKKRAAQKQLIADQDAKLMHMETRLAELKEDKEVAELRYSRLLASNEEMRKRLDLLEEVRINPSPVSLKKVR